ncbi:MAG: hypothetical protein MJ078_01315 [Clostridia bacterium]|nr:hypothetical protein [Clostridia bacterium]
MSKLFIILLALILAIQPETSAEKPVHGTEILYGSPVIDGEIDDLYAESYRYVLPEGENLNYPTNNPTARDAMANTSAVAYYLYDASYLYVCVEVHDETILTMGEDWRYETKWPWNDDGVEIYVSFGHNGSFAVHTDAYGYRSVVDEEIWGDNHSTAQTYHDTPFEDYATSFPDKNTYVVEIRFALGEGIKAGSQIGSFIEIDDRFSLEAASNGATTVIGALFPYPRDPAGKEFAVTLSEKKAESVREKRMKSAVLAVAGLLFAEEKD